MKPLDFCLKFNEKLVKDIVTSIIECTHEMVMYGVENKTFEWNNGSDNAFTLFNIDIYENSNGPQMSFHEITNIVLTFRDNKISEDLQFNVIDIFNNRVELCDEVNDDIIISIPLTKSTEVDEGYVFQLQTESPVMPFSVENLLLLQEIGATLDDDHGK